MKASRFKVVCAILLLVILVVAGLDAKKKEKPSKGDSSKSKSPNDDSPTTTASYVNPKMKPMQNKQMEKKQEKKGDKKGEKKLQDAPVKNTSSDIPPTVSDISPVTPKMATTPINNSTTPSDISIILPNIPDFLDSVKSQELPGAREIGPRVGCQIPAVKSDSSVEDLEKNLTVLWAQVQALSNPVHIHVHSGRALSPAHHYHRHGDKSPKGHKKSRSGSKSASHSHSDSHHSHFGSENKNKSDKDEGKRSSHKGHGGCHGQKRHEQGYTGHRPEGHNHEGHGHKHENHSIGGHGHLDHGHAGHNHSHEGHGQGGHGNQDHSHTGHNHSPPIPGHEGHNHSHEDHGHSHQGHDHSHRGHSLGGHGREGHGHDGHRDHSHSHGGHGHKHYGHEDHYDKDRYHHKGHSHSPSKGHGYSPSKVHHQGQYYKTDEGRGHSTHVHIHVTVDEKPSWKQEVSQGNHRHNITKTPSVSEESVYGRCDLRSFGSGLSGYVLLRQKEVGSLEVRVNITGFMVPAHAVTTTPPEEDLSPFFNETEQTLQGVVDIVQDLHGFHVHEFGDFSQGCLSFGSHYNPDGVLHGGLDHNVRHVGDWGNIKVDEQGTSVSYFSVSDSTLRGPHSILGRGIVVHGQADDLGEGDAPASQTTGNAGGRAACCIIGQTKPVPDHIWEEGLLKGENDTVSLANNKLTIPGQ